jgi:hydroxymethylbilane synthase
MSPVPESLILASRGSRLALLQAEAVVELFRRAHPAVEVSVAPVTTAGDRDRRPFGAIGEVGLFTTEVERAVLEGRADAAVHSAKDLTAELGEGCALVCVPPRGPVAEVVVGGAGASGEERLHSLSPGARVGTSSMRRRVLVSEARPDLEVTELRGNLDTRLARVAGGDPEAAILAAAGIERLGADAPCAPLDPAWWVPAPAQGAVAVEALAERRDLAELFAPLEDPGARTEITCERAFARRLQGGCSVPLGCLARAEGGRLVATGWLGSPLGAQPLRDRISGPLGDAVSLGAELAEAILEAGGDDILADLRETTAVQPSPP